jgi:O-acetylhomoserine (thiol)-lyase
MAGSSDPGFDTLALHAGAAPDPATGARAVPIHLSTSFVFQNSEHAAACSTWSARAMSTAASATPPTRCWKSAWRRWKAARAPSPPPAARRRCTWPWPRWPARAHHIVASSALYGGSHNLLHYTLARFGIEHHLRQAG